MKNENKTWLLIGQITETTEAGATSSEAGATSSEAGATSSEACDCYACRERTKHSKPKGMTSSTSYYDCMIDNLNNIDSISELEDDQILRLREKLKEIEGKLKEKAKPKTITISGEAHNMIKNYCLTINESIGEWSEKSLINIINSIL